jgi:hypothetical protein
MEMKMKMKMKICPTNKDGVLFKKNLLRDLVYCSLKL